MIAASKLPSLHHRLLLAAAISAGVVGPTTALADVTASAYVQDERNPVSAPPPATGPVTAQQTGGTLGSSQYAYSFADASAGILRTTAQAGLVGPYILPATAAASISETIMFSGGFGSTAYLDWSFEGAITLAGAPYPQAAFAQFQILANTIFGSVGGYQTLSAFAANCGFGVNCVVGTSTARTGTVEIPISQYGASINSSLSTFATYGNLVDFGNTSRLYLRLPDGVTYTSGSGQFLASATPIFATAVPEPSTYALFMAGVGLLAARRRISQRT